jgi:hypothetical protein
LTLFGNGAHKQYIRSAKNLLGGFDRNQMTANNFSAKWR